ncbi:hypothetical protein TCAL_15256 [Tigriopus californicus]|uniref:DRBM domain-containing protein n=2 Tax=Tigriopus californicus TaxID=6832 RepID=A0A553NFI3_TIGCA|nr:hypothetical protein TCAL_15256 [Tigriopus californicus]
MEFVFLEPANFVYNSAMKMWSKDDMRGNYRVKLEIAGMDFYGQADMPQLAKHNASRQALPVIQALPDMKDVLQQQAMSSSAISESDQQTSSPVEPVAPADAAIELNRISMCRDVAPEWEVLSESGPPHQKLFTLKCTFGEYSATGTARAKKMAKSLAAADILKILPPEWKAPHQKTKKKQKKRKATSSSESDEASKKACTDPSGPDSTPMIGPVIPTSPSKSKKEDTSSGKRVYEVVQVANPICALYEYANRAKLPDPVFECVSENLIKTWEKNGKLFRKLEFTFRLGFKDKEYFATAPLKKTAKTQVATEAWNLIRGELF